MPAAISKTQTELRDPIFDLNNRVDAIQAELHALRRGRGGLQVSLPELHDAPSGRIDAQKLAVYMGLPLKRLAEGLQLDYKAVHRNPSAAGFQSALQPVKRALELLHQFFHKPEMVRVWLNTAHPDLEGRTALELILANNCVAVLRILENAAAGVPV